MNKLRLAAILPAMALGLALPVYAAGTTDGNSPSNSPTATTPDSPTGASGTSATDSTSPSDQTTTGKDGARDMKKQPQSPTKEMDKATPSGSSEGASSSSGSSDKQSPTKQMDKATSDQRSPGTTPSATPDSSSPSSKY